MFWTIPLMLWSGSRLHDRRRVTASRPGTSIIPVQRHRFSQSRPAIAYWLILGCSGRRNSALNRMQTTDQLFNWTPVSLAELNDPQELHAMEAKCTPAKL